MYKRQVAALPAATSAEGDLIERADFEGPEGLRLGFTLVAGGGIDYDVDHVCLHVAEPELTTLALAEAGFVPRAQALHVADKHIVVSGAPGRAERPLLDHIAVRVASVEAVAAKARERGLSIDERAPDDACAVVLPGPEQLRLRFVEQTPAT